MKIGRPWPGEIGFGSRQTPADWFDWKPITHLSKKQLRQIMSPDEGASWGGFLWVWCPFWGQVEACGYASKWSITGSWGGLIVEPEWYRPSGRPSNWREYYNQRLTLVRAQERGLFVVH